MPAFLSAFESSVPGTYHRQGSLTTCESDCRADHATYNMCPPSCAEDRAERAWFRRWEIRVLRRREDAVAVQPGRAGVQGGLPLRPVRGANEPCPPGLSVDVGLWSRNAQRSAPCHAALSSRAMRRANRPRASRRVWSPRWSGPHKHTMATGSPWGSSTGAATPQDPGSSSPWHTA